MIRVLLADDHALLREGLRILLLAQKGIEIVGEASDGESAWRLAAELRPDVVLMDVAMPGTNGIEATRRLLEQVPTARVIALSMHADRRFVMEMLKAGASAYVLKHGAFSELAEAIEAVTSGRTFLSPRVTGVVVDSIREPVSPVPSGLERLSEREREILLLVVEGYNTKSIADRLGLSGKTVDGHRRSFMKKLGFQSVAELTRFAIREGLVHAGEIGS